MDKGAWWGYSPWGHKESAMTERWTLSLSGLHQASQVVPANAGDAIDAGSSPGSGRSPGGGHGNPLQYSLPGEGSNRVIYVTRFWNFEKHNPDRPGRMCTIVIQGLSRTRDLFPLPPEHASAVLASWHPTALLPSHSPWQGPLIGSQSYANLLSIPR